MTTHKALEILIGESRRRPLTFHHSLFLKIADKFDLFFKATVGFLLRGFVTLLEMVVKKANKNDLVWGRV